MGKDGKDGKDKKDKKDKSMKAREGRDNQVYSASGSRVVAGCVCVNNDSSQVLMISSAAHPNRWILPKGGVEKDELSVEGDFSESAVRETWEEAGVTGKVTKYLGKYDDMRKPIEYKDSLIPKTEFHFYEMEVENLADVWPENRKRKWAGFEEAKADLTKAKRLELIEALKDSSLKR